MPVVMCTYLSLTNLPSSRLQFVGKHFIIRMQIQNNTQFANDLLRFVLGSLPIRTQ